ncbi:MAG: hypothetical protein R8J94_02360 [Acidimicrobiia bacterium]|nr:hypothetical protein [Acidimicrobiia bacterium]
MTTPILFLLGAVALSALGGLIVWIASRPRPERFGSTIDSFNRDLDALAPPGTQKQRSADHARSAPARRQHAAPGPTNGRQNPTGDRPRPGPRPTSRPGGN